MNKKDFTEYKRSFERDVASKASFALGKTELAPVRLGRLSKTRVADLLGHFFVDDEVLVINYYGHMVRSSGFLKRVEEVRQHFKGKQVHMIEATVVHFASIRMEHVAKYAPELVGRFPMFKSMVLRTRGFKYDL